MKRTAVSAALWATVAATLCLSLIIYPHPLAPASAAPPAADLKSEAQWRSEASRYDAAVRAIGGIATMNLATVGDLRKAFDIVNREHPNLQFQYSKLVAFALADQTYTSAVKARLAPGGQAAEAFLNEIKADPKAILKLNGAETLKARLLKSGEADARTLLAAIERLKKLLESIKGSGTLSSPAISVKSSALTYQERVDRALAAAAFTTGAIASADLTHFYKIVEEEICLRDARERYKKCISESPLPAGGDSEPIFDFFRNLPPHLVDDTDKSTRCLDILIQAKLTCTGVRL